MFWEKSGLVNVNLADPQGRTPLHFAVAHGCVDAGIKEDSIPKFL